ncbi:dual specificity protein phosphatase [Marinomonas sp. THO17]|uniref:dual specificity protein phosphatase family protein n=1 Tax=Marinomonas sp. THO17 TaxID=3149048 RepID=UPI00336BC583
MTSSKPKKRYPRPPMSLIVENIEGYNLDIYLGGSIAAANRQLHQEHKIKIIFNCAVNLDIDLVTSPDHKHQTPLLNFGAGHVRYYKIGLIDGPGNPTEMLLSGYHLLRAALLQRMPEKASYPVKEQGNLLIHCRGGRSRSVALLALFLHLEYPHTYPSLQNAIDLIRTKRELHPDEWYETPKPALINAAEEAAKMAKHLRLLTL